MESKKYTGINIGPIIETLSLAKRPRELWAASYLFSYLMENIIDEIIGHKGVIVSPAVLSKDSADKTVGLYPDRVFIEGEVDASDIIKKALEKVSRDLNIKNLDNYINAMSLSLESPSIISDLNRYLNNTELYNRASNNDKRDDIIRLIQTKDNSPLFQIAFGEREYPIKSLAEIATFVLEKQDPVVYNYLCEILHNDDEDESDFYTKIKEEFKKTYKSYFKYFCIVQADGDNMGNIVSNIPIDKVKLLSESLLDFGKNSCQAIRDYGGMPIYAGGDDLLFIAPVISMDEKNNAANIFDLIKNIDSQYQAVQNMVTEYSSPLKVLSTSMSYGISITYYKYPLYEAFESAKRQLFDFAKNINEKNAISWCWQEHSGSSFKGAFSKSDKELLPKYEKLVASSCDDALVSAVAHKLRANAYILSLFVDMGEKERICRIKAFFKENMDFDNKEDIEKAYITDVQELLLELFKVAQSTLIKDENGNIEKDAQKIKEAKLTMLVHNIYGMLRTAKFINGEEDNHE